MKKQAAFLTLAITSVIATAGEPASFDPVPVAGTASRAQVEAEFTTAAKSGMLPRTGEVGAFGVDVPAAAVRDAAAVRAEGRQSSALHRNVGEV